MKRLIALFALMAVSVAWGGRKPPYIDSYIEPATSASDVTIAAPGAKLRNCITSITTISDSTYTFRILDGGATDYAILLGADQGLAQDYGRDDPFCGDPNKAMYLTIDNGTFNINYKGFIVR
jgi:hypothetical protein